MKYAGIRLEESKHVKLLKVAKARHQKLPDFIRLVYDGIINGSIEIPSCVTTSKKDR